MSTLAGLIQAIVKPVPDVQREILRLHVPGNVTSIEARIQGTFSGAFETRHRAPRRGSQGSPPVQRHAARRSPGSRLTTDGGAQAQRSQ
jgi:hypothetical protein